MEGSKGLTPGEGLYHKTFYASLFVTARHFNTILEPTRVELMRLHSKGSKAHYKHWSSDLGKRTSLQHNNINFHNKNFL
jgi:hypothetical protein